MSDNSKKTTQPPLDMGSDTVEGGYGSIWGRFGSGTRVAGPLGSDGSCDDIEGPPSSMATSVRRGGGTWLSSGVRRPFCGGEIVDGSQTPRRYPDTRFPSRRASLRSSNDTWDATDLEVWYAIEPLEPSEACSRDKACKLANDQTDGAKCHDSKCIDCINNDDCGACTGINDHATELKYCTIDNPCNNCGFNPQHPFKSSLPATHSLCVY